MQVVQIGDILARRKDPILIQDGKSYKRITIKINHNGISMRDEEIGKRIGTKKQFTVQSGQFLLSKIDALHGAFGIVPQELDGAIITGNFWTFDVNAVLLVTEWLLIFTSSEEFIDICRRSSSGTTNRKYLDEKKFLQQEIRLPDKKMQHEIVERYKNAKVLHDRLRDEHTTQKQLIEKLKQSVFMDAIVGRLISDHPEGKNAILELEAIDEIKKTLVREKKIKKQAPLSKVSKEEELITLPADWEWTRLNTIFCFIDYRGKTPKKISNGVRLITAKNVKQGFLRLTPEEFISEKDYEIWMRRGFPEKGDIFFTTEAPLGNVAQYEIDEKIALAQRVITFHAFGSLNMRCFKYFLMSKVIQNAIFKKATGTTAKGVKASKLKQIPIPFPPIKEQKRIADKIDLLLGKCNAFTLESQSQLSHSDKLTEFLLRELFQQTVV